MFVHVMKRTDATQHALESADHTASSRQHELLISIDNADSVGDGQIYNFSLYYVDYEMKRGYPLPDLSNVWKGVTAALYHITCLLYTSPSPRDQRGSRMPSSA